MNTEKLEVEQLQENIAMFQELDRRSQGYAIRAFHKAGHVLMYHHFRMRHGNVSFEGIDSIEDDLTYQSLKDTNIPERFLLIALGGVMMEALITKSNTNVATSTDEDVSKAILLVVINNRMNNKRTVEDDILSFATAATQVGDVLIQYQREARLLLYQLLEKKKLNYAEVASLFKNHKT